MLEHRFFNKLLGPEINLALAKEKHEEVMRVRFDRGVWVGGQSSSAGAFE